MSSPHYYFFDLLPAAYSYYIPIFFFNDPATTAIYTLSLHDALPISTQLVPALTLVGAGQLTVGAVSSVTVKVVVRSEDTRLNSSHTVISYAVFCLKKKIMVNNI